MSKPSRYLNPICVECHKCERELVRVGALYICPDCYPKVFGTDNPVVLERETYQSMLKKQRDEYDQYEDSKLEGLMTKEHCKGCEDNFYNGHNPHGVKECWCFKNAKLVMRKEVHLDQRPPWKQKSKLFPSCFKKKGYVYVDSDREG